MLVDNVRIVTLICVWRMLEEYNYMRGFLIARVYKGHNTRKGVCGYFLHLSCYYVWKELTIIYYFLITKT